MADQVGNPGLDPRVAVETVRPSDAALRAGAYLNSATAALQRALHPDEDVFSHAQEIFPKPGARRADMVALREYSPAEEAVIRTAAAELGPGRATPQTIEDLGHRTVGVHLIEAGLLHKVAAELAMAVDPDNPAPIIAIASNRTIPLLRKKANDSEPDVPDAERLSTHRLLAIGGKEIDNPDFYRRSGVFDEKPQPSIAELRAVAGTEYEAVKQFMLSMTDALEEDIYPIGYDTDTGDPLHEETGQLTYLGHYKGPPMFILRKDPKSDGTILDTASTMRMAASVAEAVIGQQLDVIAYHTSATYKPSRAADALHCAITAEQTSRHLPRIIVPTYGYNLLADIRGVKPEPPSMEQIVGELHKSAISAAELEAVLST